MLVRILTSVIGLLVFAGVIIAPPFVLSAALFVLTAIMLWELYGVMNARLPVKIVGYLSEIVLFGGFLTDKISLALFAVIMLFVVSCVFLHGKETAEGVMSQGLITVFVTAAMLSIALTELSFGKYAVILPFVVAWLTDTGAYFAGSLLGKHKLVPTISPKKTVEGAVGGVILSTVGAIVFGLIFAERAADAVYIAAFLGIGAVGSVLSQLGDLAASCIKRDFGKKDYGNILPGHGGAMDRFDSVLFAAPFVYFVLRIIFTMSIA